MPCTGNKRLTIANGRLIKTKEAREFDNACYIWGLRLKSNLFEYRRQAKQWIDAGYVLKAEFRFCFPKKMLMDKAGIPKALDDSNRLKDAEDAASEIIDVNDKYFVNKPLLKIPWNKEYMAYTVIITPTTWPEYQEMRLES